METITHLDWHTGNVETKREQGPLTQHSLEATGELDLGNGKGVSQVQATVHVRVRERSEPFRVLCSDFRGSHGPRSGIHGFGVSRSGRSGRINLKDLLVGPVLLSLFLQLDDGVSLAGLAVKV